MNPDRLITAALAAGVALLAAEVRRASRERDTARKEFEALVGRIAERPTTVFLPHVEPPSVSSEPTYLSDLPYHDEVWDDFVSANESTEPHTEDVE